MNRQADAARRSTSRFFGRSAVVVFAAACLSLALGSGRAADIDTAASHIGFTMTTRWGQVLQGNFPHYRGKIVDLPDGRHQVRLQLDTATVEITGPAAYTRFARGSGFFDADDWPHVVFVSDAYVPAMLHDGGKLAGELRIRGVRRREVFTIQPAACARPGLDCDAIATGTVQRSDYGMTRWNFAFTGDVLFEMHIRIRKPAGT